MGEKRHYSEQELLNKYANQLVVHLYKTKNVQKEHEFFEACNRLDIPQTFRGKVHQQLFSKGIIKSQVWRDDGPIELAERGLIYFEQIDAEYFEETGFSYLTSPIKMTLAEACEFVFQHHKSREHSIDWKDRDQFGENPPENLYDARNRMLNEGTLRYNERKRTILNLEVEDADSYTEAQTILKNQRKKQGETHYHAPVINNEMSGTTYGTVLQGYQVKYTMGASEEAQLAAWGVQQSQIELLQELLNEKDKKSFPSKAFGWLGGVATTILSQGLGDNLPAIAHFLERTLRDSL